MTNVDDGERNPVAEAKFKPSTRLYVVLARKAPMGVVFRRGPSKQVLLVSWNMEKHEFRTTPPRPQRGSGMRHALLLLFLGLPLAGCAPPAGAPNDAGDGTIEIWRAPRGDADFIAAVANRHTFLFNGNLRADRISVVGSRLKALGCREPRLLREKAEDEGNDHIFYYSAWKCG